MRITKYTHACVRLEDDGRVLVIDPGTWSEPTALIGADAVLVTHEHSDHIDVLRLAELGVPVYAPAGADIAGLGVIPVSAGDAFTAAGFPVAAVGGRHAPSMKDSPTARISATSSTARSITRATRSTCPPNRSRHYSSQLRGRG